ncbi:hypothetical protein GCM10010425_47940 [Streptomyces spororaveus]|uniref:Uncharacterized protein n=1 Tax=Streptomyces spororaveus TaxID=284039 RepID=A0ABQ3T8I7_9ACTN|nr:hypothetical protein Sspor_22400 [Streptomyces spororaveus]
MGISLHRGRTAGQDTDPGTECAAPEPDASTVPESAERVDYLPGNGHPRRQGWSCSAARARSVSPRYGSRVEADRSGPDAGSSSAAGAVALGGRGDLRGIRLV